MFLDILAVSSLKTSVVGGVTGIKSPTLPPWILMFIDLASAIVCLLAPHPIKAFTKRVANFLISASSISLPLVALS